MTKLCYVCNKKLWVWRQNLSELKTNHSKMTIGNLLRRFLVDIKSERDIDHKSNRICVECFDAIDEYDRLRTTAKTKELELQTLFLTTEMFFVKNNRDEIVGNSAFTSMNDIIQEESNDDCKENGESDNVEIMQPNEILSSDKMPELQGEDEGDEVTQDDDDELYELYDVTQDEEDSQNDTQNDDSVESDIELSDAVKTEHDAVQNDEYENESDDEKFKLLVELSNKIEEIHRKKEKPINIYFGPPNKRQPYECDICKNGQTYRKIVDLKRHMREHSKFCDICDIKFSEKAKFKSHMNCHDRFPGFICLICQHKLDDKDSYKKHLELHKKYASNSQCVLCEKTYENKGMLRVHMVIHNEPSLLCDLCGKKFRHIGSLNQHYKIHLNVRPKKCIYCPKSFKSTSALKVHTRTHTQTVRPFACSVCDMKFKLKDHMQRHERRHTENTKTLKCLLCKSAFEHKFYLRQHMKRKHGVEMTQ